MPNCKVVAGDDAGRHQQLDQRGEPDPDYYQKQSVARPFHARSQPILCKNPQQRQCAAQGHPPLAREQACGQAPRLGRRGGMGKKQRYRKKADRR